MIDSNFRGPWQRLLFEPCAALCARSGLLPHHLTLLSLLLGLSCLPALYFHKPLLAVVLLLLSGMLDATDGTLARKLSKVSNSGAILDISCDRAVEAAVVIGLYLYDPPQRGLLCLLLLTSFYLCVTSFLLSGIFTANTSKKSFHYSAGLIERTETFLFFPLVILWEQTFFWASIAFILLVFLTAFMRLRQMLTQHG